MTRPRINVSSTVPGVGRVNASANVIATWDEDAPVEYVEEAIKQAARDAIQRARVVHGIESRPAAASPVERQYDAAKARLSQVPEAYR